ncbi:MAG TPA: hypothetical protein VI876_02265 [Dehalococcoidia bacterium]|nr:hypothetical protein [Dehalococcoidia bacterium]
MARYLVTCPHTLEDCIGDIDSVLGHSKELLARFDWGCKAGEHVAWVVVEAGNEATARMMLPVSMRNKANVQAVNKFTPEDIVQMTTHKPG